MAFPPPPYADAVCGTFVAGEDLVGSWWAYPDSAPLLLGGHSPQVYILDANTVPPAGLSLGGWIPADVGQIGIVPTPGLLLGSVPPLAAGQLYIVPTPGIALGGEPPVARISAIVAAPDAGLLLGAEIPAMQISSTIAAIDAGLLLGAVIPIFLGQIFLFASECIEADLVPSVCQDEDLMAAECVDIEIFATVVR